MDLVVCDHSDRLAADRPSLWLSGDQGASAGEQGLVLAPSHPSGKGSTRL